MATKSWFKFGSKKVLSVATAASKPSAELPAEADTNPKVAADSTRADTKPEVAAKGTNPEVAAKGTNPEVAAKGTNPEVAAKGTNPEVAAKGTNPEVAAKGAKPEVAAKGAKPEVAAKGAKPEVAADSTRADTNAEVSPDELSNKSRKPKKRHRSKSKSRQNSAPSDAPPSAPSDSQLPVGAEAKPGSQDAEARPGSQDAEAKPGSQDADARPGSQDAEARLGSQDAEARPGSQDAEAKPGSQDAEAGPGSQDVDYNALVMMAGTREEKTGKPERVNSSSPIRHPSESPRAKHLRRKESSESPRHRSALTHYTDIRRVLQEAKAWLENPDEKGGEILELLSHQYTQMSLKVASAPMLTNMEKMVDRLQEEHTFLQRQHAQRTDTVKKMIQKIKDMEDEKVQVTRAARELRKMNKRIETQSHIELELQKLEREVGCLQEKEIYLKNCIILLTTKFSKIAAKEKQLLCQVSKHGEATPEGGENAQLCAQKLFEVEAIQKARVQKRYDIRAKLKALDEKNQVEVQQILSLEEKLRHAHFSISRQRNSIRHYMRRKKRRLPEESVVPEVAPATNVEAAPATIVEAAPATIVEAAPATIIEPAPPRNAEAAPPRNAEAAPTINAEAAPTINAEAAPTINADAAPTINAEAAPTINAEAAPTINADAEPATIVETAPATNAEAAPATNVEAAPTTNAETLPATNAEALPTTNAKAVPATNVEAAPANVEAAPANVEAAPANVEAPAMEVLPVTLTTAISKS